MKKKKRLSEEDKIKFIEKKMATGNYTLEIDDSKPFCFVYKLIPNYKNQKPPEGGNLYIDGL